MMADKGFVASCDVAQCSWNQNKDCSCPAITIQRHKEHADCDTYLNEENPWLPE